MKINFDFETKTDLRRQDHFALGFFQKRANFKMYNNNMPDDENME
jgi:hypothetical protein